MISEKILELIHKEIDGQINSAEKDELHTYLKDNPEAESHYKQFQKTVNAVEDLHDIEPGIDLKDRIMSSIEWKDSYGLQESFDKNVFLPGIFANQGVRQVVTFSFGFVFCFLLITVLFKNPFETQPSDPQLLMGAIGVERLDTYTLIDSLTYETDLGSITVNQNVQEEVNLLQTSINRMRNITVQFNYDPSLLSFAGYYPVGSQANRVSKLDSLILVSSSSAADYILVFHSITNIKATLEIEVSSDKIPIANKTFVFNRDN